MTQTRAAFRFCAALLSGLAAFVLCSCSTEPGSQGQQGSEPAVTVETVLVQPERAELTLEAVGTVLANESVIVRPEISGKIEDISFTETSHVEKGQKLFTLDSDLLKAEYEEVKANHAFARSQYDRAKNLRKNRVMPDAQYDDAYRSYLNARSRMNTLATRMEKHSIRAPFSGITDFKYVSTGDYVSAGQDLVRIDDIATVKAEFSLPERHAQHLSVGDTVRVSFDALQETFNGVVEHISPAVVVETRSVIARARIDNRRETIKPGMFCAVTVITGVRENAVMVPQEALLLRGDRHVVFINAGGTAEMRKVTTGSFDRGRVELVSGVTAGESVVVAGAQKLAPGIKLNIAAGTNDDL